MVGPANRNPRRDSSRLIASDCGVDEASSDIDRQRFTSGLPPTNPQRNSAKEPASCRRERRARAFPIAASTFRRFRTIPGSARRRATSRSPYRATRPGRNPENALRYPSRRWRTVRQESPACAPSRTRNSNRRTSSRTGTPHSSSWYRVISASSPADQGHRGCAAPILPIPSPFLARMRVYRVIILVCAGNNRVARVHDMRTSDSPFRINAAGVPAATGLYDPKNEHDSCGVGFVARIDGVSQHIVVQRGIQILVNLEHRGALGGDKSTGDGAGILLEIPDTFLRQVCPGTGLYLPPRGEYAAGTVFLPMDEALADRCSQALERAAAAE